MFFLSIELHYIYLVGGCVRVLEPVGFVADQQVTARVRLGVEPLRVEPERLLLLLLHACYKYNGQAANVVAKKICSDAGAMATHIRASQKLVNSIESALSIITKDLPYVHECVCVCVVHI